MVHVNPYNADVTMRIALNKSTTDYQIFTEEFGTVGLQNGARPRQIMADDTTFEQMYQDKVNFT